MRYLIVEDDPNLRLLWRTILGDRGYTVTEADTLAAAKQALQEQVFDAMILDLYLGRENALTLAMLVDTANPGCKVIVVTGAADVKDAELRRTAPSVVSVHRKPVDIEDLLDVCIRLEDTTSRRAAR